jgi:hypothetical protein
VENALTSVNKEDRLIEARRERRAKDAPKTR